MPGGFAGVDVFFVISGFLMTGIIFRGIEQENFSILKFYVARANRIIPALAVLCLLLLVFGWFYLTPLDYRALGKHVGSSMGFLSNIIYWRESGYFDAASHEKWLLHTWSLSAEWQFYIIYPLVLVAMRKFMSLKAMKATVLVGTVLGFIFCVIATYKWPNPAYYLLPTRAWEMMIGGVAYLYPLKLAENKKKVFEWVGLALIILSYIFISKENLWPGYLALIPVFGAFLLIQAQRNDSIVTDNIVFQSLGKWSYSIYLWHWPLVVAIYYFSLNEQFIYFGIITSVILGFFSNKYIERVKFKNNFYNLTQYLKCQPIWFVFIVGSFGALIFIYNGIANEIRFDEYNLNIVEQQNRNKREQFCGKVDSNGTSPSCIYGEGPIKAIIIGDSHAQAQIASIGELAGKYGYSVLDRGLSGCNTIEGLYSLDRVGNKDRRCGMLVSNTIEDAANKYPGIPIVIINRWSQNLYGKNEDNYDSKPNRFVDKIFSERDDDYRVNISNHMINTICNFSKNNPVYLVRPIPELKLDVPKTMFKNTGETVKISYKEYMKRSELAYDIQNRAKNVCNAKILNPIPYLCDSRYCYGDKEGIPLYFDDDHLSKYGSDLISKIYSDLFK